MHNQSVNPGLNAHRAPRVDLGQSGYQEQNVSRAQSVNQERNVNRALSASRGPIAGAPCLPMKQCLLARLRSRGVNAIPLRKPPPMAGTARSPASSGFLPWPEPDVRGRKQTGLWRYCANLTKLSITRLWPAPSNSISSLLPSCAATLP